jgi:poly(3-hydroxybutyrate) depolymerase
MFEYVPADPQPALVVVLHGCTQTAASYDFGAGWSTLADRHGFVLLLPEQQRANNAKNCFNWFRAGDIERGGGEAMSIRNMVEKMIVDHGSHRPANGHAGTAHGGRPGGRPPQRPTSLQRSCCPRYRRPVETASVIGREN